MTTANRLQFHEWQINPGLPAIPLTDVMNSDGSLACRIEHYFDPIPESANAIVQFQNRMQVLTSDIGNYRTVIVDSVSFLQDAAVNYQRVTGAGTTAAGNTDPRKWYMFAKEQVQPELISRLAWVRNQNIVLVAHASEKENEFSGELMRGIDAIGKMPKSLGRSFGEVYRAHVVDEMGPHPANPTLLTPTGNRIHQLQTRAGGGWGAMSLIHAPNPCQPDWNRLWDGGYPVKPLRCIVYGDFGTGKSMFASTWPQPMLVLAFDPADKLVHYERFALAG